MSFIIFEAIFLSLNSINAILAIQYLKSIESGFIEVNTFIIPSIKIFYLIIIFSILSLLVGLYSYKFQSNLVDIAGKIHIFKKPLINKMLLSSISGVPIVLFIILLVIFFEFFLILSLSIFLYIFFKFISLKKIKNSLDDIFLIKETSLPIFALSKRNQILGIILIFFGIFITLSFLNNNFITLNHSIIIIIFYRYCVSQILQARLIQQFQQIKKNKLIKDEF